jgi:hypothetical protein
LFRYDEAELNKSAATIRDGAVFGFVQGTDPEVILLLQDELVDGERQWRYTCSRATSGGLEVRRDDTLIWSAERNYSPSDPLAETFTLTEPLDR